MTPRIADRVSALVGKRPGIRAFLSFAGSAILAFGLCHIHDKSAVTEGGVLGAMLLIEHFLHISPAVSGIFLDGAAYLYGAGMLGGEFVFYSVLSSGGFCIFYAISEQIPPVFPQIAAYPLEAALLGAAFVGIGAGLCVAAGGAPGGDDALAMAIGKRFGIRIEWVYLISDGVVLLLSLTYIPLSRIVYSLLTVFLSGQIVGRIARRFSFLCE